MYVYTLSSGSPEGNQPHNEHHRFMIRLGICYSRFARIKVQFSIFLPTIGGEDALSRPDSRKPWVTDPKSVNDTVYIRYIIDVT